MRFIRLSLLVIALALGGAVLASPALAAPSAATLPAHGHGDCDGYGHGKGSDHKTRYTAAKTVKVAGGTTSLTVAAGTLKVLTANGVKVTPASGASASGATFSFPITGGSVVASNAKGTITHRGGLTFTVGKTTLTVKNFTVDTNKGVLTAQVGNTSTRIPLLKLDASGAKISMSNGRLVVSNVKASLTATAAAALNKTFKVKLFTSGLAIGTARVSAKPASKA